MPKALFFNVPGHGHITPSLPLVAELVQRGHEIIYFATGEYRAGIEAAGASFRAYSIIQDDYFTSRGLSGSVPQKVALALITTAAEILPELLDIARAEKPDAILFDGMCPWGALVAKVLRLPSVALLALAPPTKPPPSAMFKLLPLFLPLIFRDFGAGLEANRRAKALTEKYDLPPFSYGFPGILSNTGDISVSYTSRYFQQFADTLSDSFRFVGWTLNESPANGEFSLERLQGRRLIYVSLGTLNNEDAAFFKTCIEALADSESFVIMTTGKRISPESFGVLPENVAIYDWVPQVEVLKHADLFISHGGLNSIHDSMYLRVPMLLVPQQEEQTLNAMRVVELGAGLMLKKSQITAEIVRDTAARLLRESDFKTQAKQIGDTFREAGGAARAADEVEALLRKR
jgi:MGT family glycosyltransferase